jgi:hypothetical protein
MILAVMMNYLQTSPNIWSCFLSFLRSKTKQIYIKRLFWQVRSFMQPFVKSAPPSTPLFHNEIATKNIRSVATVVKFTYISVLHFYSLVSVGTHKCCLMWYISRRWSSTQPHVVIWAVEFCFCFFVFSRTYTTSNSFPFKGGPVLCLTSCAKFV